jgi:hypothetical protein
MNEKKREKEREKEEEQEEEENVREMVGKKIIHVPTTEQLRYLQNIYGKNDVPLFS